VLNSDPVTLGVVRADGAGSFATRFRIPLNVPPGIHTITVGGVSTSGRATITVASSRGAFGVTGGPTDWLLLLGLSCVTAGAVLLNVRRQAR